MSPRPLFVAEPPATWAARPPAVVDSSVVVAQLFEEAEGAQAVESMRGHALHAPALLAFEVANVARSKARAGAPAAKTALALVTYDELRIDLHPVPAQAMFDIAAQFELSAYDAAYLWLAAHLKAPLLTFDRRLALAAQQHLGRDS